MNKRFLLSLLASPTVLASMVSMMAMANRVNAAEVVTHPEKGVSCIHSPHNVNPKLVCMRVAQADTTTTLAMKPTVQEDTQQQQANPDALEFTEEESDTAIAMFGCDCPACINGVRAMRGLPPIS